jgi:uncharacterized membrane protein
MNGLTGVVWVFSAVLAVVFLVTGINKAFRYKQVREMLPWTKDVPRAMVQFIGIAEILGALGLIVPPIVGLIWPAVADICAQLTLVAALALCILMLSAALFHTLRHESGEAWMNMLLLLMSAFVAYMGWTLMP